MKIMLIYPLPRLARKPGPHWLPLGLSFIAASLQKYGHNVSIFDRFATAATVGPDREKINFLMLEKLQEFKPDLIGFNTTTPQIYDTAECAALVRRKHSGLIIAGGHHTTALPELTLRRIPELNGIIQGEGELALTRLAGGADPLTLPGVWWKDGDTITGSPPEQVTNLDDLPFPALDLLDMNFYTRPGRSVIKAHHLSAMSLITSRGCLKKCDFCTESMTYGPGVRLHSPEYVLEWINRISTEYPIKGLYFLDNNFLVDHERAAAICEMLISAGLHRKINFAIQARVSCIDPEIVKLLKQAGCILLEMGIETSSQAQLDSIHKGTTVDMNRQALDMCRRAGLAAHAYLMQGFKGETMSDLERHLYWLRKAGSHFTVALSMLQLYPGTRLYQKYGNSFFEENPWTEEAVTAYYQQDHLSAVSPAERTKWHKKYFKAAARRRNRLAILRYNSPILILRLLLGKIWRFLPISIIFY